MPPGSGNRDSYSARSVNANSTRDAVIEPICRVGLQLLVPYLRTAVAFGTRRESRLQVGTSRRVPKSKPEEQVGGTGDTNRALPASLGLFFQK